jgi:hypothetical protein
VMRRALVIALALVAAAPALAQAEPLITRSCNGSSVCSGWFTAPVRLTWTVSGGSATSGCVDITLTQDTKGIQQGCIASDGTDMVERTVTITIDRTAPLVTGALPDRLPDHGGWYSRPVTFTPEGTDATSGLLGCDKPSYAGPDSVSASVLATCRDVAGNSASRAFPLRYDATPPDLSPATVATGDRVVRVAWPAGSSATLTRTPGSGESANAVVYEGEGTGFADREVRNNRQYRYVLTLTDEAGNAASREFVVTPRRQLVQPAKRAVVSAPPLLQWTAVRGARYYNVQLFRGKRKILSAWPRRAELQLKERWRYRGKRYRLKEGRYRWYVWPGEGPRAANRYGKRIGARSFVVDR